MKALFDFNLFAGKEAWGQVNGELELPSIPAVGDLVDILAGRHALGDLGIPTRLRLDGVAPHEEDGKALPILMLQDVSVSTRSDAEALARRLEPLGIVASDFPIPGEED